MLVFLISFLDTRQAKYLWINFDLRAPIDDKSTEVTWKLIFESRDCKLKHTLIFEEFARWKVERESVNCEWK